MLFGFSSSFGAIPYHFLHHSISIISDCNLFYQFQSRAMCYLGYEYHILDNAFLVHKPGIKIYKADHKRDEITNRSSTLLKNVIEPHLKIIYGDKAECNWTLHKYIWKSQQNFKLICWTVKCHVNLALSFWVRFVLSVDEVCFTVQLVLLMF